MNRQTIRIGYLVHKWSSLVATAFVLMLCVTGLPLIFHDEIERYFDPPLERGQPAAGTVAPSIDALVAKTRAAHPGEAVVSVAFAKDRPVVYVDTAAATPSGPGHGHRQAYDARSGEEIALPPPARKGFMDVMLELHTKLFMGLPGTLFLGVMGLLLVVAVISGIVVYAPFMRRLDFATVRLDRSRRLKWLDLHNLLGIATIAWVLVVGLTGFINSLHDPIAAQVRVRFMALTASYRDAPPPKQLSSVDAAIATVRRAAPDMALVSLWFPGTRFSTPHHYAVFTRGNTPITSRMLNAALIDAETGAFTDAPAMSWYAKALFVSQPLHFGDYGGLPLKVIWALLNVVTIVVLGSGLYLWLGRRRTPLARRVDEIEGGGMPDERSA